MLVPCLAQCGLKMVNLGYTYLADRLTPEGKTIETALDHIYMSNKTESKTETRKLEESSTDLFSLFCILNIDITEKKQYTTLL